jgi:hypothetical protein
MCDRGTPRLCYWATPIALSLLRAISLRKYRNLSVPGLASPVDCQVSVSRRLQLLPGWKLVVLGWKRVVRMPPWAIPIMISKASARLRTNTFAHRSDDRTTNARAVLTATWRCMVVWPAHTVSRLTGASQATRPMRLMEFFSFAHREITLLLQTAYSNDQAGAFENFHQLVEDTFIVLRPGPKIFFQYELRFVNCLKSQLLIGHFCPPIKIVVQSPLVAHQKNRVPK